MQLEIEPTPEARIIIDTGSFQHYLKQTLDIFKAVDRSIIRIESPTPEWHKTILKLMMNWEIFIHRLLVSEPHHAEFRIHPVKVSKFQQLLPGDTIGGQFNFKTKEESGQHKIIITPEFDPDQCIQIFLNKLQYQWFAEDAQGKIKWKRTIEL